eukprot:2711438-Rhodomonas_salina.4
MNSLSVKLVPKCVPVPNNSVQLARWCVEKPATCESPRMLKPVLRCLLLFISSLLHLHAGFDFLYVTKLKRDPRVPGHPYSKVMMMKTLTTSHRP